MVNIEIMGNTMTVGELISKLSKYDTSLPVISEGCDCWGTIVSIKETEQGELLLLERGN